VVEERDRATAEYQRRFHGIDWADPSLYHLTLSTSLLDRPVAPRRTVMDG
jgi:cytidylate kinase